MYTGNYNYDIITREALFQLRKSKLNGEKSYSHSDKNLYARTISESSELY